MNASGQEKKEEKKLENTEQEIKQNTLPSIQTSILIRDEAKITEVFLNYEGLIPDHLKNILQRFKNQISTAYINNNNIANLLTSIQDSKSLQHFGLILNSLNDSELLMPLLNAIVNKASLVDLQFCETGINLAAAVALTNAILTKAKPIKLSLIKCTLENPEVVNAIAPSLQNIVSLDLSLTDLHTRMPLLADNIATSKTLQELTLNHCCLNDNDVKDLATALDNNTSLRVLNLRGVRWNQSGLHALSLLLIKLPLVELNCSNTTREPVSFVNIFRAIVHKHSLKTLILDDISRSLNSDELIALCPAVKFLHVLNLEINQQELNFKAITNFTDAITTSETLRELELRFSEFFDLRIANALVNSKSLANNSLRSLHFVGCGFHEDFMLCLTPVIKSLRELTISSIRSEQKGMDALFSALADGESKLEILNFNNNYLPNYINGFAEAIGKNKSLLRLNISSTCLHDDDIDLLAKQLEHSNIQYLNVSFNMLGKKSIARLTELLRKNHNITDVVVDGPTNENIEDDLKVLHLCAEENKKFLEGRYISAITAPPRLSKLPDEIFHRCILPFAFFNPDKSLEKAELKFIEQCRATRLAMYSVNRQWNGSGESSCIDDAKLKTLIADLKVMPYVHEVNLSNNKITDEGADLLIEFLRGPNNIIAMDLDFNRISNEKHKTIQQLIAKNKLNLRANNLQRLKPINPFQERDLKQINFNVINEIIQAVRVRTGAALNYYVYSLDLHNRGLTDADAKCLIGVLRKNKDIIDVELEGNHINFNLVTQIKNLAEKNRIDQGLLLPEQRNDCMTMSTRTS